MLHRSLLSLFCLIIIASCTQVRKATDVITQPTSREVYARDFEENDALYLEWNSAYAKAHKDTISATKRDLAFELPYSSVGTFALTYLKPYIYTFQLSEGEILLTEVKTSVDSARVFIDVFRWKNDSVLSTKSFISNERESKSISKEITISGKYTVIIQPEIETETAFKTRIYTQPQYAFPVSGKGNKAVQSLWGAPRGGGKRTHKGVDIFASRGTPVVAITDGRISFTGEKGLGGKQVWLRDGLFGQSLYYAHLDSILTTTGKRVKTGDTLGFVGNTGNARTTPPHLHFGIYQRSGAVDPYPFVRYRAIPEINDSLKSNIGIVSRNNANLRKIPSGKGDRITQLNRKDTLLLLEKKENWFHVVARDTLQGYIYQSSVNPTELN